MAQIKKRDNSYLMDKVALRVNHLPEGEIRVLDCFAGRGNIWNGVAHVTGRQIRRLPIDIRDGIGFHLAGDNMAYLPGINLSRFNVVDLDAYGVPYEQLKVLFERKYRGMVFATFIQTLFGGLPHAMLCEIGFTQQMIEKCPTMFYRSGWQYFLQWLAQNGVRKVWERTHGRIHYLCFDGAEALYEGLDSGAASTAVNPS